MRSSVDLPRTFRVRQLYDDPTVADVPAAVEEQLATLDLARRVGAGDSVAIAAGSRGITNIAAVVSAVAAHLRGLGARPFVVPAMGSHGGGTADGQRAILADHGITEEGCGCPIRVSMETAVVAEAAAGFPIHIDAHAHAADHIVVCNRIKPHTQFSGPVESGLMKMLLIGLGKRAGAQIYHRAIKDFSFGEIVAQVAPEVVERCSVVAGVALVENRRGGTALVEAILGPEIATREPRLLDRAREMMPRLPFDRADILLIDRVGKDISGTGFDVAVVGRKEAFHAAGENEWPKVRMVALRDLTDASHGNGEGMGLAEFCLQRMLDKVDLRITRINSLTSGHLPASMLPIAMPNDRELLAAMLPHIGLAPPQEARLLWVRDTKTLDEVECGEVYREEARARPDLEVLTGLRPLPIDRVGDLPATVDGHPDLAPAAAAVTGARAPT